MGKLKKLAILAATITTVTAIPAALLSKGEGNEQTTLNPVKKVKKEFKIPTFSVKLIPQLSSAIYIKNRYTEIKCLKSYFTTIKFGEFKTQKTSPNNISNFSESIQSCLLVEYYKQNYTDGKWWGGLRIIWALKSETQGFMTVTSARTVKGDLWGNSVAYTLKKEDSGNSWSTLNMQEINLRKKDKNGLKSLIPQASSSLPGSLNKENYWGFNPDLGKICNTGDCETVSGAMEHKSYSWEFTKDNQGSPICSWTSSNINNWWSRIFAWNGFNNKMKDIKGKWETKTWS